MEKAENSIKSRRIKNENTMKKILLILAAGFLMVTCAEKNSGITSKDLQGVYNADFSSYMSGLMQDEDDANSFSANFVKLLFSDLEVTMTFTEDSLLMETEGSAIGLMQGLAYGKSNGKLLAAYQYEIRNDTLLYTKEGDKDFEEYGIIRKIDKKCDSLIIITSEDDGSVGYLPLSRKK